MTPSLSTENVIFGINRLGISHRQDWNFGFDVKEYSTLKYIEIDCFKIHLHL